VTAPKTLEYNRSMDNVLLTHEALKLTPLERAQLIDVLWKSLDPKEQAEIDKAWGLEASDRLTAYRKGELDALNGPEALDALEKDLLVSKLGE